MLKLSYMITHPISNKSGPVFTVFTPTYNRAHTLYRVYQSLQQQTFTDFEWLIVDDGSTDDTPALIENWQKQAPFSIRYYHQNNAGKHMAFNKGVLLAAGAYFLPIDSDDGFVPSALEEMWYWWLQIPENQRLAYTGIVTLCQFENGKICGDYFSHSPLDTNALELRYVHKKRGETWGFHRTEILKQYPFPKDENVRFIPENVVWDVIATKYKIRCINAPLRIFYQDSGNQLTKSSPARKASVKDYFLLMLNRDWHYFINDPTSITKWALLYVRYSLHAKDWRFLSMRQYQHAGAFVLMLLTTVPGILLYSLDIIRYSNGEH